MIEQTPSTSAHSPYELLKPRLLKTSLATELPRNTYILDEEANIYKRLEDTRSGEAVISCGGLFRYDASVGVKGLLSRNYDFLPSLRFLPPVFMGSDLNVASICSAFSEDYLPSELVNEKNYHNGRPELLTAIRQVGIDCLAGANAHLVDAGTNGIWKTLDNITAAGLIPGGIGKDKSPLFEVNGIKVGILSYTLDCAGIDRYIDKKGAEESIQIFKSKKLKSDVANLRDRGAEFILAYINAEPGDVDITGTERASAAKKAAEAGADYVVCTGKTLVGKYWKHETADGRVVPMATAIGNLLSGKPNATHFAAVVVRITLKRDAEGNITVEDLFVPLKHVGNQYMTPLVPAVRGMYPFYGKEDFGPCLDLIRIKTEDRIPILTEVPKRLTADGNEHITCAGYDIIFDTHAKDAPSMARTIQAFTSASAEAGRLVVITSDIPKAGEEAHRALAEEIKDCDIGLLCCLGTHSRILCEEAARNRRTAVFETDDTRFSDILIRLLAPGDRLLVLDATAEGRFRDLIMPMLGKVPIYWNPYF